MTERFWLEEAKLSITDAVTDHGPRKQCEQGVRCVYPT